MKIFIAVPTFETIYPDTFKSIYGLNQAGQDVVFDYMRGYDCAQARNNIAEQALNENADYVLMIDSDMVLPNDILVNMLDDPKDVCLGVCAIRNHENVYTGEVSAYKLGEFNYNKRYTDDEINKLMADGKNRIKIHGGGMACAFINTNIFETLKYPWFKTVDYANKTSLSEDLYFCSLCKEAGIDIYLDTRVRCGHVFRHVQWT